MTQKNPELSTNLGASIRITLIVFGFLILLSLAQYKHNEYFTSPLRILLWEKEPLLFLAVSFIGKVVYYYQKKLYNTWSWKILLANKNRVVQLIFSLFGALVFLVEVISVIYFSQPESVKIDWAIFAVTMFSIHWLSEKIGYWLARMGYTNKEEFPHYQEYLGAW